MIGILIRNILQFCCKLRAFFRRSTRPITDIQIQKKQSFLAYLSDVVLQGKDYGFAQWN